jgi:hypothetical protein
MAKVKLTMALPDDVIEMLREQAKEQGFVSPALYARHLIAKGLKLMAAPAGIERHHAGVFQDLLDEVRALRREAEHGQKDN